ncbi:MAG: transcription antitermination factor NusB [Holosporales bacterium]|nr:transcription antitermination factor NusB [Holosporales bacterium]
MVKSLSLSARRAARILAVQALYQLNQSSNLNAESVLQEFIDYRKNLNDLPAKNTDWEFFASLFLRASGKKTEIANIVADLLNKRWSMDRLDSVLKSILFVGVVEIIYFPEIPVKTSLDEYVEVAKLFFDKQETSFVNGTLNAVAHRFRETDFAGQK